MGELAAAITRQLRRTSLVSGGGMAAAIAICLAACAAGNGALRLRVVEDDSAVSCPEQATTLPIRQLAARVAAGVESAARERGADGIRASYDLSTPDLFAVSEAGDRRVALVFDPRTGPGEIDPHFLAAVVDACSATVVDLYWIFPNDILSPPR